ncbi:hypothetical protein ACQPVP_10260 [Clostridium nigeriense]|uniref:hypothetical protein n=1 Tax=Clostridium nigeriense TaxID=1805470 RepID=UPI003D344840
MCFHTIPTNLSTPNYLYEENNYYSVENRTGFLGLDNHYTPYEINLEIKAMETKRMYLICTIEKEINKTGFEIEEEYKKGLVLCSKRYDDAREILESFSKYI